MVLLRFMLFVTLLLAFDVLNSEDLDTLLTSLAASKEVTPEEPVSVPASKAEAKEIEPELPKMPEPGLPKMPEPGLPKGSEVVAAPMVEPRAVEPAVEPKFAPVMPKPILPVVQPVMPKVAVSPVLPKVAPTVFAPGVVAAPGAPKMVGVPTPIVAKAVAAQPEEEKAQMQITDVHEIVDDGLNTLHIDSGGNWLEKRVWYKKAEQLFEEIRTTVQKAADIRMKFVHEVNQVGQQIDEFYETVGFQKGQIEELLQAVSTELTTEEKIRGGDLSSDERSIRLKIHADQQLFQSMSADFKLIEDLDDQVDKTMMKAFKEIDACRAMETKAWNNFKDIGMELDDKKARVLYYEMENFHKNIEQKLTYLQTNLLQYLQNQLVTKVTQTTTQIKASVQTLNSKGLALQTLLQKNSAGDFVVLQKRDEVQAQAATAKTAAATAHAEEKLEDMSAKQKKTSQPAWYKDVWCMVLNYGCIAWHKVTQWFMIAACCVQTVLCKIQEMICKLLGY